MGLAEPGLNRLIRTAYEVLGLQTYFTAGPKEVRAWTIHKGDTAPEAAGVIHTDFEHGFIRAEVIAYDDYIANNGEAGCQGSRQDALGRQGILLSGTETSSISASTSREALIYSHVRDRGDLGSGQGARSAVASMGLAATP